MAQWRHAVEYELRLGNGPFPLSDDAFVAQQFTRHGLPLRVRHCWKRLLQLDVGVLKRTKGQRLLRTQAAI